MVPMNRSMPASVFFVFSFISYSIFMIKLIELVGRFAQNYQKINSKNYKNRRRAKPLIIFLFNFFIILRPIGRPYIDDRAVKSIVFCAVDSSFDTEAQRTSQGSK